MSKNVWFTSDTHFSHKNIITYCNRLCDTIEEMNEKIIEVWNLHIMKNDTVYFLGDFSLMRNIDILKSIFDRLNGTIYMIKGNHDMLSNEKYRQIGFKEVYDRPILWGENFILSHEPISTDILNGSKLINIHGHTHRLCIEGSYINVCIDTNEFKPYLHEEVRNLAKGLK